MPVAWHAIGYLIFGGVAAALILLSLADYSRVETVGGVIVPDKGVSLITPTRGGIVSDLSVHDGQTVSAGDELASIRVEEDSRSGVSTGTQIEAAVRRQDESLASQISAVTASAQAQVFQLSAQKSGISAEILQIQSQIGLQRDLVASAQRDLDRTRTVAERGFISQRDLQYREEALVSRRQGLAQFVQTLAAKRATLIELERTAAQIMAQADAQKAGLAASRAELVQQSANNSGARSYVLRAPVSGQVTALTARVGQVANQQSALMTIIPAGSKLRAELTVPSAAIGFLKPGQEVRLALDAFPYQRFGTIRGQVLTVARSAVSKQSESGATTLVYPVTVAVDRIYVVAFGRKEPLVSGMSLSARIVTEKQSLLQWLFEPLFAVRRR
ncbi:MAG: HlyD family efflux transporter periplasmic adaptor subunit [Sphingopyxis sp.]|nr:HlyD family efflux transporter periplasmic adaptor subunit [Sphingopyxis sp.]